MKTDEEINQMACKYASSFPSQYEERKNAFIAGCNAMQQVKLFATPDVVGRSEQLKAFAVWLQKRMWEGGDKDFDELVDEFLSL